MKVLIITYYWPPAGGSGVQRWLKFVKYLRDFEIEPVVYTVKSNHVIEDTTLLTEVPEGIEVIKKSIFEPNAILSLFSSKSKSKSAGFLEEKPSFFGKIVRYIRANYFIPDARKFWIKPSIKFLSNYLKDNPVDVIITTGPPHSLHLIGLGLKEKLKIKWISDFRDPWTEIDYFHKLPLTSNSKKKHLKLEEKVVVNSDEVIVVGKTMKDNFLRYNKHISVISNGYDSNEAVEATLDSQFTITHIGLMNADRNPRNLWKVIEEITQENTDFKKDLKIRLIGKVSNEIKQELETFDQTNVEYVDYVPHDEVMRYQFSSQILLLCVNNVPSAKGIVTGKIFEYLNAKRPILAIGPEDGDAAEILKRTQSGRIFDFNSHKEIKSHILDLYNNYQSGKNDVNSVDIKKYHRRELTNQLAKLIKKQNS